MYAISMDYVSANVAGYSVGIIISFLLNRSWTFRHQGSWQLSLVRWMVVVSVAYSLNLVVIVRLHRALEFSTYIVQLAGIAVYTMTTFLGGRYFAFSNPDRGAQEKKQ
jgi:putative flippase GtrA